MEENAGNVFFCIQIIYENAYEKNVCCCFIDLYLLSYWLGSTKAWKSNTSNYDSGIG